MNVSEKELFQLLIQRYQQMESTKSNNARSFKPVKEVLDAFVSRFNANNSTVGI